MLRVYHSNRLDVLEALMEFIVERQRLDDPFQAEMVLVQSTGMAQWLQMTLAARFGIAANIEFPLPASFIWDMFVRVLKDIPGESAFSKQSMSWKLMTLLPQHLEEDDFILLRQYLSDDGDKRKLFQLAARVADLYDQYLVYRRSADALGGRPAGGRSRRCPAVAGAAVAGAGELHRRAGAAAVAPRQSLPALYQYPGKSGRTARRAAVARLHLRDFRAAAGLSSGPAGAG